MVYIGVLSNGGGYTTPRAIDKLKNAKEAKTDTKIINFASPQDNAALAEEVQKCLTTINRNGSETHYCSRAEAFLDLVQNKKIHAPNSLKIINQIKEQAKKMDAIFLPGGGDIPAIWYKDNIQSEPSDYQYRTLVELTLISEAKKNGIPLMGVCRGFQIINVFNGKKLKRDVPNQHGIQNFELIEKEKKGLLTHIFKQGVKGKVMHHQGVCVREGMNGKGDLEPLTKADGLIKAVESKYPAASPIIGTQFHPEIYDPSDMGGLTPNNEAFFQILFKSAITRKQKQQITPEKLIEARKNLKPLLFKSAITRKQKQQITPEKLIEARKNLKPLYVPTKMEKTINYMMTSVKYVMSLSFLV